MNQKHGEGDAARQNPNHRDLANEATRSMAKEREKWMKGKLHSTQASALVQTSPNKGNEAHGKESHRDAHGEKVHDKGPQSKKAHSKEAHSMEVHNEEAHHKGAHSKEAHRKDSHSKEGHKEGHSEEVLSKEAHAKPAAHSRSATIKDTLKVQEAAVIKHEH